MADYNRQHWLTIRDSGGSLQRFLRSIWRFVPLPVVKCGEGRNGAKRALRVGPRKFWRVLSK